MQYSGINMALLTHYMLQFDVYLIRVQVNNEGMEHFIWKWNFNFAIQTKKSTWSQVWTI